MRYLFAAVVSAAVLDAHGLLRPVAMLVGGLYALTLWGNFLWERRR